MQKSHPIVICVKGFVIAALVACGTFVQAAEPEAKKVIAPSVASAAPVAVLQGAVARVNGIAIDAAEYRRAKKMIQRGQAVPPEQQAEFDKQVMNQLVSAELLYQAGLKLEVKDIDKQVEEKLAQEKNQQNFVKTIKEFGMSEKDIRDYMRRSLIINAFIEKTIVPKVTVSEEETRKLLEEVQLQIKRQKVEAAVQSYIADALKSAKVEIISNQ